MNAALFTTTFYPTLGGAEKQLDLLARGLLDRGHNPLVIAPAPKSAYDDARLPYPVFRYPKIRSKKFGLRWHARWMPELHARHKFDFVHAHGAYPAAYMVAGFAKRAGIPLLVRAYGGDVLPGEAIAGSWWLRWRLRRALGCADRLIAQNAELAGILGSLSGHAERVVRIPNGIDLAEIPDLPPVAEAGAGPKTACTLSNLYPKKGLDLLVRAWPAVAAASPGARLVVAGHGPDREALASLCRSLGLDGLVSFPGNVTGQAKWELLAGSDLYISSARREPFSNALLEAVACGMRVVATRTGANPEVVEACGHGALVEVGDIAGLSAAIVRGFEEGRPGLGPEARRERIAPFAYENTLGAYLRMVESVVR